MKLAIITALVFLAFITPSALAGEYDDWERTCIGDALIMNKTVGIVPNLKLAEQNLTCSFGCNNQTQNCIPGYPTSEESIMIVIGIIFIAAMLLYLAIKLDKKHWEVQLLFLFVSLFMILTGIYLISNLQNLSWTQINNILTSNYTVVMWSVIFFLFIIIIKFMMEIFRGWIESNKRKKGPRRKR